MGEFFALISIFAHFARKESHKFPSPQITKRFGFNSCQKFCFEFHQRFERRQGAQIHFFTVSVCHIGGLGCSSFDMFRWCTPACQAASFDAIISSHIPSGR